MAEKENSAFRLYRFVQKMVEQKTSLPTAQVLVSTFGTRTDANAQKQNAALAKVMFLLFDELDSLVSELKQHNYTKETIDSITAPFDRLSAVGLAQPWPQNREKFSASLPVLRSVGDSPNVLSEDAAAINNDELTELSKSVEELRQEVETSELPLQVKQFIFQQLDLISDAIREYPITGIKAFKKAAERSIFHEVEHSEIIVQYSKSPQISRLKAIQAKIGGICKFSIEFSKFVVAMDSIYHHGGAEVGHHVIGWVQHFLK